MKEFQETNQMRHLPASCNDYFQYKFNFKDRIFDSVVIYRPKLCKQNVAVKMKMRLATNFDG